MNMTEKESLEKKFEYIPINPEHYDSDNIIQHYEDSQDMKKYLQTLQKDSKNTSAWEDAGGLLRKNPYYYFDPDVNRSPRTDLEDAVSEEYHNFARLAKNHSSKIYNDIKPESYLELVQKVQLCKIGNKKHDEFVDAMNEYKMLNEISRDSNKMRDYVKEKLGDRPTWSQISVMRYGESDINVMFKFFFNVAQSNLSSVMYNENGEANLGFLENVFKDSLKEIEEDLEDEDYSSKENKDVFEANVEPFYSVLFEEAYKHEKEDEDLNSEKEDRNERRKERRAKGMRF